MHIRQAGQRVATSLSADPGVQPLMNRVPAVRTHEGPTQVECVCGLDCALEGLDARGRFDML